MRACGAGRRRRAWHIGRLEYRRAATKHDPLARSGRRCRHRCRREGCGRGRACGSLMANLTGHTALVTGADGKKIIAADHGECA